MTVKELINILSQYSSDAEIRIEGSIQVRTQEVIDLEESWEPDMDDYGTCDVMDIY